MTDAATVRATETEWHQARSDGARVGRWSAVLGGLGLPCLAVVASMVAPGHGSTAGRYAWVFGCSLALFLPLVLFIWWSNDRQMARSNRMVRRLLESALEESARQADESRHKHFETSLSNALDMAHGEGEVVEVISRGLAGAVPGSPVELLLADNSHAHLQRVTGHSPTAELPGCGVDSPADCPAARRGRTQRFEDSRGLDACPKMARGDGEPTSAVCVPVAIMGRTVGVLHATGPAGRPPPEAEVEDLRLLADLAGSRLGLLRMVAEAEHQASRDSLTGLLNRRVLESRLTALRQQAPTIAVAMADLDHFKLLNDTYGHDTGDRALRLFAEAIRSGIGEEDLAGRHGGEEFVLAFPRRRAAEAAEILDAIRADLAVGAARAGLPEFTASFGVVDLGDGEDLADALRRADRALFDAKHSGRNRTVSHASSGPAPAPAR